MFDAGILTANVHTRPSLSVVSRKPTARKTRNPVTKSAVGGGNDGNIGGTFGGNGKGGGNGGNGGNGGDDGGEESFGKNSGDRFRRPLHVLLTTFAASYAPHALAGKKPESKLEEANAFIAGLDFTEFAEIFGKEFGISTAVGVGVGIVAKLAAKTALVMLASVYALLRW